MGGLLNDIDPLLLAKLTHEPQSVLSLCAYFRCDRRVLQKAREALEEDYPVLSSQEGYWIAEDASAYFRVLENDQKQLKASARRYSKRRKAMWRYFPEFQPTLFQIDEVA